MNATKLILVFLIVVALGTVWFMDSRFFHWSDRVLPDPQTMTGETVEEPVTNDTFNNKKFVPTNEWQTIEKGIQLYCCTVILARNSVLFNIRLLYISQLTLLNDEIDCF